MTTTQIEALKKKLKEHHSLYRFPVKAEIWEDIYDQICNGWNSGWELEMGNHDTGTDIIAGNRKQLKSGALNFNQETLKWSGSRTTQYATLEEKINFFDQDHHDEYVFLARNKQEWTNGEKVYYLITLDPNFIKYSNLDWVPTYGTRGKNMGIRNGWKANGPDYSAVIQGACGDQLWTTVSLDYIKEHATFLKITI